MEHAASTHRHQKSYHHQSKAGNKGSYMQEPWKEETFPTEDGYEYNDWDESWTQYPAEEIDDWEEEADLETFLFGESDWIHRDVLDSDVLDSYVEEECSADKSLYEAYLEHKKGRDTLNQVRRGRGFWPVIAILLPMAVQQRWLCETLTGHSGKSTTHKGKSKGSKSGKWQKQGRQKQESWQEFCER